ncbi:MFS transporter [Cellulomonas composti]|uniref:Major facilitator superfamily (MFS) profile domain-containing protein n=1 Tax=Cellulomonas composti TaxID=266130 RepID=A0A511J5X5_9CELL|nr:MFS transporter [Cellulomonas composti]GEL93396.1 hypothetical protein CCO02nite_00540 [Cellulomonas composti]
MHRDRLTFAFYGCFVVWGWFLYSFGPSVPLLADDFGITSAQAGLHGTAMAGGAVLAAFLTPRVVARWGRRPALLAALGLIVLGVVGLVLAPALWASLPAMFVIALGGNIAISCAQPGLAFHHGEAASAAVTEANGVGSTIGLVGPLAVGLTVAIGWGWRPAVAVTIVLVAVTAWLTARRPVGGAMTPPTVGRRAVAAADRTVSGAATTTETAAATETADEPHVTLAGPHGVDPVVGSVEALALAVVSDDETPAERRAWHAGLPAWCFLAAVVAAIALENATTYWSTDLVREQTGAGPGIATATTAGLVAGMSAIRFVVGPMSLRVPPALLLAAGFVVAVAGWAVLWTSTETVIALVGLFVAGLGYGVQYPLAISLLLSTAPHAGDAAQARATLAGGLAIGVAPFLLGALADAVGMHAAFVVVPVIAVLGLAAAVLGGRLVGRPTATASVVEVTR